MKLCPKCESIMNENSYFGELICIRCNYKEPIHNNLWVDKLKYDLVGGIEQYPSNESLMDKINEVINIVNNITNPRVLKGDFKGYD